MSVYLADKAEVSSIDANWRVAVSRTDTNLVRNLTLAGLKTTVRTWDGATAGDLFVDGSGAEDIRKSNLSAVTDPSTSDDAGAGYRIGSRWINTITGKVWEAVSVATLAAVWRDLTATSPPAGSGTELQIRGSSTAFGALTGSSSANGGIALASQASGSVPLSLTLASGHTADAIQVTSSGGTAGDRFKITSAGIVDSDGYISRGSFGGYGFTATQSNAFRADADGFAVVSSGVRLGNSTPIKWSSTANWYDTEDLGLARNASGVAEFNNGTAGQYRDVLVRSIGLGVAPSGVTGGINGNVTINAASGSPLTVQANGTTALSVDSNRRTIFNANGALTTVAASINFNDVNYWNFGVTIATASQALYLADNMVNIGGGYMYLTTAGKGQIKTYNGLELLPAALGGTGGITIGDAGHFTVGTTTGTKFGTGTTQKVGFWNATPIVQPSAAEQVALVNNTAGAYDGTLEALPDPTDSPASADALRDDLVSVLLPALRNNFTDLYTQLAAVRTALVNAGLMKGAA